MVFTINFTQNLLIINTFLNLKKKKKKVHTIDNEVSLGCLCCFEKVVYWAREGFTLRSRGNGGLKLKVKTFGDESPKC